ncbi:MAG: hypothetical protein AMJ90_09250 [candidate division Zixibacteria bacterium SM23_73_2]|nr:MAG: hypothetical protein AMJ90_09250 [candidate division Zixibacteria bacterium SM23_73_2]
MKKRTEEKIKKILEKIKASQKILLTSHIEPDGDSVCSQLALANYLDSLGKEYQIINQGEIPHKYLFLDEKKRIKNKSRPRRLSPNSEGFDLAIFIECSNLDRSGGVRRLLSKKSFLINIDHHQDNSLFGKINYVDHSASAAGEVIYDILDVSGFPLDKKTAELIYVAILTDTGRFRYSSITPKTFRICADLLECGIDTNFLTQRIYYDFSERSLKLLRTVLEKIELYQDKRICFLTITHPMLKKFKVPYQDTDGFVDFSLSIAGSKVGALFLELEEGLTQVSLRSSDFMDVSKIAKSFGGGGHKNASGFTQKGKVQRIKKALLDSILKKLKGKDNLS